MCVCHVIWVCVCSYVTYECIMCVNDIECEWDMPHTWTSWHTHEIQSIAFGVSFHPNLQSLSLFHTHTHAWVTFQIRIIQIKLMHMRVNVCVCVSHVNKLYHYEQTQKHMCFPKTQKHICFYTCVFHEQTQKPKKDMCAFLQHTYGVCVCVCVWIRHVTYEGVMWNMNGSSHIWMSYVTYGWCM